MNPKCFGRYSEDSIGRTSVECDYCGKYDACVRTSISNTKRNESG